MLPHPPSPLQRKYLRIDGLTVGFIHEGRRWPLRRKRLVLVHGTGCSADSWRYQIRDLSRQFEVIVPDLPGHGASDPAAIPSIERYAGVVGGVLQRVGGRKAFLVGHSMGGAVALQAALDRPGSLKGLILIATASYLETMALTPDILLWAVAALPHKFKGMFFSDLVTDEALAIARYDVRRCSLETVLADFAICKGFDFRGRLKQLKLPTLVLCGAGDLITPVRYSERLRKEIQGSELVVTRRLATCSLSSHLRGSTPQSGSLSVRSRSVIAGHQGGR